MKIYVIVVTYNGMQCYNRCFTSLRESKLPICTIVVDNASTDGTAEYIRKHYPEVILIENKENVGFGRANNQAMRYAMDNGCDYVFLMNQDTWIEQNTISQLVAISEKHPEYGIVSPMHMLADRSKLNMVLGLHQDNMTLLSDLYVGKVFDIYETNYVNAAAWLLPRNTLVTVGGFDPIFKHYEEDDNYLNRVIYHGLKVGVCPSVQIVHDHKDSASSTDNLTMRHQQFLLVKWTNVNQPFSLWKEERYYIRKLLINILRGDMRKSNEIMRQMRYCRKMKSAIEYSRKESMYKKASWL